MTYQNPPRKSLGTLYRAQKTKPRSPDLIGAQKIQIPTLQELCEFSKKCDGDEIVCPIAAWINGEPGRQYLVIGRRLLIVQEQKSPIAVRRLSLSSRK